MRPAGGLYSTGNNLLTLMQSNLGFFGHPLDPVFARTHRVQFKTEDHDVALGWDAAQFNQYDFSVLYVYGLIGGYTSYIGLDEKRKIGVLVLCNTFNWHERVGQNLLLEMAAAMDGICGCRSAQPTMRSPTELFAARTNYPAHWWTPVATNGAPSWEILP